MKALIDINILLDVILRREPHFSQSKRIIDCCITFIDGYIALHSFATLFYVLKESEHKDVDYIITRDTDDFKNCAVPAITPEQFLLIAHENWEE